MEIAEVPDYIRANFKKGVTISELSKKCFTSPTAFKKRFKAMHGLPVGKFTMKIKMYASADLLTSGRFDKIEKVGREIGYWNISQFALAFRKFYGYLPHDVFIKRERFVAVKDIDKNEGIATLLKLYGSYDEPSKLSFEKHFGVSLILILRSLNTGIKVQVSDTTMLNK